MIFEDWGLMPYREAWEKQKNIFSRLISNPAMEEHIIFVEHPAVYTIGFHGNSDNLIASKTQLKHINTECIRIERGGDITFHGPGQLVVYPILNLYRRGIGVKKYIHLLEQSVVSLLKTYDIPAITDESAIGVWIDWKKPEARKICAIGVKISRGISMHGLALNVNTDLEAFKLINPCGFIDKGVTSISRELGITISLDEIKQKLYKILYDTFYC